MGYKPNNADHDAEKAVNNGLHAGEWLVYGDYNLERTADGVLYVAARTGPCGMVRVEDLTYYRPLVDYPDLFLRFARLKLEVLGPIFWSDSLMSYPHVFGHEYDYKRLETEMNAEIALEWARNNGVLGLTDGSPPRRGGEPFRRGGNPMGGERDAVWRLVVEAYVASRALRLYEAATDPDGVDIETIRDVTPLGRESRDFARRRALEEVARIAERMLSGRCHPILRRKNDGIVQGWGFGDLLGAMWLQMMWLVTADSSRRCQRSGCNKVVTTTSREFKELKYTQGQRGYHPNRYATRKDKTYCSDSCKTRASRARKAQEG